MKSTFKTFGRYIFGFDDWWMHDNLWLYLESRRVKYHKNCLSAVFSHCLDDEITWETTMISDTKALHTIYFGNEIFSIETDFEDGIFDVLSN